MEKTPLGIILVGLLAVMAGACDESSSSSSSSSTAKSPATAKAAPAAGEWVAACEAYAKQCPGWKDVDKCKAKCAELDRPEKHEMCSFVFCSVETGKCDDDEEGDTAVMKCLSDKGWQ